MWEMISLRPRVTITESSRKSVCLNRMPASSSWMQMAFLMVVLSPARLTKAALLLILVNFRMLISCALTPCNE